MNPQGDEDEKRQTEGYLDKEFQVKERASQVESPRWRGAGKGKEEKRGGQAQAGGMDARRRDRQTGHPGPKQNFSCPATR